MKKDIFSEIINSINDSILEKKNALKGNFQKILIKKINKKIAFIDGGNTELLKAVNFSLQFIRTAALIFQDNKKIKTNINEFFVLVNANENNGKIEYKTRTFTVKGKAIEELKFDSLDPTIKEGIEKADISKIAGIVRRFSEIELAKDTIDELNDGDILVLDGSLKCLVTNEEEYMRQLCAKAVENNIVAVSLAKTSRIFMEDGSCLLSQLNQSSVGLDYEWFYPISDDKEYNIYAVKLNKHSSYLFELNIFNKQKDKIEDVLNLLIANSNDSVFPGYPYGLILTDIFARVSNEEKDYLLTKFQLKAGKSWDKIKTSINVLNCHSILDKIS